MKNSQIVLIKEVKMSTLSNQIKLDEYYGNDLGTKGNKNKWKLVGLISGISTIGLTILSLIGNGIIDIDAFPDLSSDQLIGLDSAAAANGLVSATCAQKMLRMYHLKKNVAKPNKNSPFYCE